jgi:hypothetical protein
LQDANLDELNQWSSKIFDKLKTLPELRDVATPELRDVATPELRDVATDQQTGGATLTLSIDRDRAADRCWAQKGRRDCRRHSRAGNPARHRVRSGSTL